MRKVTFRKRIYTAKDDKALLDKVARNNPQYTRIFINNFISLNAQDYEEPKKTQKSGIKFQQLVAGAEALVNVSIGNTVGQSEINRRAGICQGCKIDGEPGVITVSDCMGCGAAGRIANWTSALKRKLGGGYTIPNHFESKGCAVCKCSLHVMLASKMGVFDYEKDLQDERPDHCWVKRTSNNYIP